MNTIAFRDAGEDDIHALVALVTSAYRGDASRGLDHRGRPARRQPDRRLKCCAATSRAGSSGIAGRTRDDDAARERLLGCAHVSIEDGAGYFGMFSVRPELQGAGIGKHLLAEAERIARRGMERRRCA